MVRGANACTPMDCAPQPSGPRTRSACCAATCANALQGTWRAEHLCALQQAVARYAFSHQPLALCDQQSKAHLETFADKSAGQPLPPNARRHTKTNAPRFDARTPLYRMAGVALT